MKMKCEKYAYIYNLQEFQIFKNKRFTSVAFINRDIKAKQLFKKHKHFTISEKQNCDFYHKNDCFS